MPEIRGQKLASIPIVTDGNRTVHYKPDDGEALDYAELQIAQRVIKPNINSASLPNYKGFQKIASN
jgi:hypothetical protein